jgi:hypothetical protein
VAPSNEEAARTELGIYEISAPPSSSSPETPEMLIKHDTRLAVISCFLIYTTSALAGYHLLALAVTVVIACVVVLS